MQSNGSSKETAMTQQYPMEFTPDSPRMRWLCEHLSGWQFGDQGLIEAIAKTLQSDGIAIEYGAGDGVELPLTIDRLYQAGMKCRLVEIDDRRRDSLRELYPDATASKSLKWRIFVDEGIDISAVIIDIDSHDSVIMRQMLDAGVRPELLVVEHMDRHFPILTTRPAPMPEWMLGLRLHSGHAIQDTAETLQEIAREYGYDRIGMNRCNSYFVRGDRFLSLLR
jgi:hypothetical protein